MQVASGLALSLSSTLFKVGVRAGTFLVVAPVLGPVGQASIALTSAWSGVLVLLVIFGLPVRSLRELGKDTTAIKSYYYSDIVLMVWLSLVYIVIVAIIGPALFGGEELVVWNLIATASLLGAFGDYCSAVLRSVGAYTQEAFLSVGSGVLHFILLFLTIEFFPSVFSIATAVLLSRLAYFVTAHLSVVRNKIFQADSSPLIITKAKAVIAKAKPYAADAVLATAFSQIDMLILGFVLSRHDLGIYSAASRFVQLIFVLPSIVQGVVIPMLSKQCNSERFAVSARKFGFIMMFSALILALLLYSLGQNITTHFLGEAYSGVDLLWAPFAVLIIARAFESFAGILIYSTGLVAQRVLAMTVGLTVLTPLGALSADRYGSAGFVLASALVFVSMAGLYVWKLNLLNYSAGISRTLCAFVWLVVIVSSIAVLII